MAEKKKQEECKQGSPPWMATFSDMCTLLLCFFVMLLSMADFESEKFKIAARSLQGALGVLESFPTVLIAEYVQMPKLGGSEQNKKMAAKTAKKIEKLAKEKNLEESIKVKVTDSGIAIKIADPVGFRLGEADIRSKVKPLLKGISEIIDKFPQANVRVEGHTDDLPISTDKFPSNWELSAARALNVVKYMAFEGGIDPSRLSGVGYGQYRPIVPNDSEKHRKMNRRIEIYIEYLKKYDKYYEGVK